MGRLDIDLYRDGLPADNGGEVLAGVKIALTEDMTEGDFTRFLRVSLVVLELDGDDLARIGSRWQIRRVERAVWSGNLYDRRRCGGIRQGSGWHGSDTGVQRD
jgi:hypothetical protein